jgi:hypothetical protein
MHYKRKRLSYAAKCWLDAIAKGKGRMPETSAQMLDEVMGALFYDGGPDNAFWKTVVIPRASIQNMREDAV